MFKYKTGEQCPHCNNGTVTTNDFTQGCTWCGVVLDSVKTVPFYQIREGERFYSAYDKGSPPTLLVKATKEDKERLNIKGRMDSYPVDQSKQHLHHGHGPLAPCVRESELTMKGTSFGYN